MSAVRILYDRLRLVVSIMRGRPTMYRVQMFTSHIYMNEANATRIDVEIVVATKQEVRAMAEDAAAKQAAVEAEHIIQTGRELPARKRGIGYFR